MASPNPNEAQTTSAPDARAASAARPSQSAAGRARQLTLSSYDAVLRLKNARSPRLLVYADSRGLDLLRPRKSHYTGSYIHALQKQFHVTYQVLPFSHTTLVDFLNYADTVDLSSFCHVVLHCGIVDFSPRPLSNIAAVQAGKRGIPGFDELFADNADYYASPWETEYRGERTINLYSPQFLRAKVIPRLLEIPNLIWISSNHFVPGWDGNYKRGRPANIDAAVHGLEAYLHAALPRVVDLRAWTEPEVQRLTIDNLHLSRLGFDRVRSMLDPLLRSADLTR